MKTKIMLTLFLASIISTALAASYIAGAASMIRYTGAVGADPSVSGSTIAFETHEGGVGEDLNGDGDTNDWVIRYYDTSDGSLENTGAVGVLFSSYLGGNVHFGQGVSVGEDVIIGDDVVIGDWVVINADVEIEEGSQIGSNVVLGANVQIEENAVIGDGVEIGYQTQIKKGSQIGSNVVLGDNVQIGENAVIGENSTIGERLSYVQISVQIRTNNVQISNNQVVPPDSTIPPPNSSAA